MEIVFAKPAMPDQGAVAVAVFEDRTLSPQAKELDQATGGALVRAMQASRFKGKRKETLVVLAPAGVLASRVVLVGLGAPGALEPLVAQAVGGDVLGQMNAAGETVVTFWIDWSGGKAPETAAVAAANAAFGAMLKSYRFGRYKTREKEEKKPTVDRLVFAIEETAAAEAVYAGLAPVADGVVFTRDLVSEPANILYPGELARRAKGLTDLGVSVEVLDEAKMRELGMGALLGVGQGSIRGSQLVAMRWEGNAAGEPLIAFVGKGVTFDTGGISIKPSGGMEDMKWDMGGAGVVIGTMKALAGRKAKVNAVGLVGLVENMPDGNAQRPGDIVTSMSGQTIEVLNTDAEGRLVLADLLWYCQERFKAKVIIDLATLTGAIIIALGHEMAGLFSTSDQLAERLDAAGKAVGEPVWRMPLADAWDKELDSDAADMRNIGGGRGAGSAVAAHFLKRFIKDTDTQWAHLDIAGVTWSKKEKPTAPKGGTGYGVRLLDQLVRDNYEG